MRKSGFFLGKAFVDCSKLRYTISDVLDSPLRSCGDGQIH